MRERRYTRISLTWPEFAGKPAIYRVGYDTSVLSHMIATIDTKSLTLLVWAWLETGQLYRFWVQAAGVNGDWSEKQFIQNVIQL